jgi:HNH endonuclease
MTDKQLRQVWDKTGGHCHFCGDPVEFEKRGWVEGELTGYWEVDHVVQRGKGGKRSVDNCLAACTRCNRLRWHRTGEAVRELLFLGLIARDEIAKSTPRAKHSRNYASVASSKTWLDARGRACRRSRRNFGRTQSGWSPYAADPDGFRFGRQAVAGLTGPPATSR